MKIRSQTILFGKSQPSPPGGVPSTLPVSVSMELAMIMSAVLKHLLKPVGRFEASKSSMQLPPTHMHEPLVQLAQGDPFNGDP